MRVAAVVRGGLHPSGREQVVPAIVELLGRLARRFDVHAFAVAHLPEPATYPLNGFTVHDLGRPDAPLGLGLGVQARALHRAIVEHGPFDVVHGMWGDPAGVLAVRVGQQLGVPSLVTCDSGEFVALPDIGYGSGRTWLGRRRIHEVCRHASAIHVCTQFMADLSRHHGVRPLVIPIGTRPPAVVERPAEGPPWRLLQVASLSAVKNQALLIEAVALLAATHDVYLDLAGADTLDGALHRLARARRVEDRVAFHGFVPWDELEPLRARAHLYVQTSRHEAAGVAVLEAAAAGLPVVGTPVGYLADWRRERAVAVDHPTSGDLAAAIRSLIDEPGRRGVLAARAAAWATSHDAAWSAAQFEAVYRDLGASGAVTVSRGAADEASRHSGGKPDRGAGRAPV